MKKIIRNYFVEIIRVAVEMGFTLDPSEQMDEIFSQAEVYVFENSDKTAFERVELTGHGMSQNYFFCDGATDYEKQSSGEIFNFNARHKVEDEVFFHVEADGKFTPVNWFDIPLDGPSRSEYVFVFAEELRSDGTIVRLYDYFA